jgi:hypothetical protein
MKKIDIKYIISHISKQESYNNKLRDEFESDLSEPIDLKKAFDDL